MNALFRWKNERDTPVEFSTQLWIAHPAVQTPPPLPDKATADVTLRRLRKFQIQPGRTYRWNISRDGKSLVSGGVRPDASNLLTISQVALTTAPATLTIKLDQP
jgi:hypothetical protein